MEEQLKSVICDVLGLAPADYRPELTSADVANWDSVLHLSLLLALEQTFGVSFDPQEGLTLTSVPAIHAALQQRGLGDNASSASS